MCVELVNLQQTALVESRAGVARRRERDLWESEMRAAARHVRVLRPAAATVVADFGRRWRAEPLPKSTAATFRAADVYGSFRIRIERILRAVRDRWIFGLAQPARRVAESWSQRSAQIKMSWVWPGFPPNTRLWLDNYVPLIVDRIGDGMRRAILARVIKGIEQGEPLKDIEAEIRRMVFRWRRSRPQAIARTEAGIISARTEHETVTGLGIPPGELLKEWLTARDDRVRGLNPRDVANHVILDGQRRRCAVPYSNGLLYPRQQGKPAAEIINCRCVQLYRRINRRRRSGTTLLTHLEHR